MKTFRDFMEASLYAPGGYYRMRSPKEDFYTAPELHPVFAEILAEEAAARLAQLAAARVPGPYFIVEMGSGSGLLARSMWASMSRRHSEWTGRVQWILVERCENLLLESIGSFGGSKTKILGFTRLEDVPRCAGFFFSNELVDAFPVHLLEKRDGRMWEVHVGHRNKERLGEISTSELAPYAEAISMHLVEGGRHAVNLEASRWMRQVSNVMATGTLLTIDYGRCFPPDVPNEPRSFYRHVTDGKLTSNAGRKDLTASVDFEALVAEGRQCGLKPVAYTSLSRYLLDHDILDRLPKPNGRNDLKIYKERNQIKTLFHPEGMGEAYKVLIQEKRPSV